MQTVDLSIIILSFGSAEQVALLKTAVESALAGQTIQVEFLVVEPTLGGGKDYGKRLNAHFQQARGRYLITLDADLADSPLPLDALWHARDSAEIVIASRYTPGGKAVVPWPRSLLSKTLNLVFSRGLDLGVRDMSSGIRLYHAQVAQQLHADSQGYEILQELLVRAFLEGYRIGEIPFRYQPNSNRRAYQRALHFSLDYLRTFHKLWKLRNSIASADYDARAYNAMMPPQRYWQRQRYKHITQLIQGQARCLDVGCGSSRIMEKLPPGSVVLDILERKLRYSRRYLHDMTLGSALELPIRTESFPCVLCSQVIEHIPRAHVLDELDRVLQPGGLLILGTPDYARWQWLVIERLYQLLLPQAYADEHITHYRYDELVDEWVTRRGYTLVDTRYILQGELIFALRKPLRP